ncbi:hypothetical protein OQA88_13397 [Cercophora sp. LCS_1]
MDVLEKLQLPLTRTDEDPRPIAVLTCGIAGSGKSTLAKAIVSKHPEFTRLSVDVILHERHGLCGIDYPSEMYGQYLEEASDEFDKLLRHLLDEKKDVIIDRSLYAKEDREYFRRLVEEKGARSILVVFRPANKEFLWERIQLRRRTAVNADSALDITPEILDSYWEGFEWPVGEGEFVVNIV